MKNGKLLKHIITLICILILVVFALGSTSTFSNFYDPYVDAKSLSNVITLKEGEEPKIINSYDISNDYFDILSDNYTCIGNTNFNGPDENLTNDIKIQCKKNGATIVLYNRDYTDTRSGVYSYGGNVSSYNVKRYNYVIYYFVKRIDMPKFGLLLTDMNAEERKNLQRNTGVIVTVVYKNTPAFYANIVRDDIVIRINEHVINNTNDFYRIYDLFNIGDGVDIDFIRNGKTHNIKFRL